MRTVTWRRGQADGQVQRENHEVAKLSLATCSADGVQSPSAAGMAVTGHALHGGVSGVVTVGQVGRGWSGSGKHIRLLSSESPNQQQGTRGAESGRRRRRKLLKLASQAGHVDKSVF